MKKAFKHFSGSLKILGLSTIFGLSANISFADTARDFTNRSNYMPGKPYRLFGVGRGNVTNLRGNVTRQGGMSYTVGNIQTDIATYGGKIEYNQEFHNHGWRVHSPFSSSASRSFDSKTGSPAMGGQTVTSFSVQGFEVHPADGYDGEQGGGYPTPTGARDEYTYIVSGTERTIRIVNQPDKPQPPKPEKPNQNNEKGDDKSDKQDNQERDKKEKLTGLDDSGTNGEYDLSNLSNDDLAQWLAEKLRDAELNTPQSEFDKDSLLACYGCPSEMQPTWIAQVIKSGDPDLIARLGISATAAAMIAQNAAQNGSSDADIAKQVRQAQAAGGAMPPNGDNDKNGIKEKNDYTNKQKQKANSAETGDKIRTPDSHPNDFQKLRGNQGYQNKYTGEIWQRSDTQHMGKQGEWKVGIGKNPPQKGSKITVDAQTGKVLKK